MTSIDNVLDTTPRVQYTAAAAQVAFDYPFAIFEDADLVVDVDGTTQTLTTDYTVSGAGDDTGGTVTFGTAPGDGAIVTIWRDVAISRTTDFQQNGPRSSSSFNDEFDKLTVIVQDLENKIGRAIRFPQNSLSTNTQAEMSPISTFFGKLLRISSTGILEAASVTDSVVTLTAEVIGALLNPRTQAEIDAGVTPTNYRYEAGNVLRYMEADGSIDNASELNSLLGSTDIASAHIIRVPKGADVAVGSQLVCVSNTTLVVEEGGYITRTWTSTSTDVHAHATLRNTNAATNAEFAIDPGPLTPTYDTKIHIQIDGEIRLSSAAQTTITGDADYDTTGGAQVRGGPHLYLTAQDSYISVTGALRGPMGYWATFLWLKDCVIDGLVIRDQAAIFEDGFHAMGLDNVTADGLDIESGDDAVAVGNIYNVPSKNFRITGVVDAKQGAGVALINLRTGASSAFAAVDEDIENFYINVAGKAGEERNMLVKIEPDYPNTGYDTIKNGHIHVELEHGATGSHDQTTPYGLRSFGGQGIKLTGTFSNPVENAIYITNGTAWTVDMTLEAPQGSNNTVFLDDCTDIKLLGEYDTNAAGTIALSNTSAEIYARCIDVPTNGYAVRIIDGTCVVKFGGKAIEATSATSSRGVQNEDADTELYILDSADLAGVDLPLNLSTAPSVLQLSQLARGFQTETATGTFTASPYILVTDIDSSGGAVTATLPDGQYDGQRKIVTMSNADNASTLSVTSHTTSDPEVFDFTGVGDTIVFEWLALMAVWRTVFIDGAAPA